MITNCASNLHVQPKFVISPQVEKQLSYEGPCTLETCQLLSEHEQQLKSAEHYRKCFLKLLEEGPPFKNYPEKKIVPRPADWLGWYYPKKEHCTRKMPAPTTISNSRKRTVPCVPKCCRRHCFNFQALFW